MAHAAKIDSNGIVREVLAVDDDKFMDAKGKTIQGKVGTFPQDTLLMDYMESLGLHDPASGEEWRFTSYNGNFRGVYAGLGYTYDRQADQFMPPETEEE
jgi:hypothetical protein